MSEGYDLTDLLKLVASECADKLRLFVGQSPVIEIRGESHAIEGPPITLDNADSMFRSVADSRQRREIHERGMVDLIHTVRGNGQFRVQARLVREEMQIEFHRVPA
jgi:Tfp pilus assembly pilus retraction ATPase PilT